MVFLGRWILDVGSLDELDSKDKFRFSGSVSSGVVFFQDAFGLQFRFLRIWFSGCWSFWILDQSLDVVF